MNHKVTPKFLIFVWLFLIGIILSITTSFKGLAEEKYSFERMLPIQLSEEISESSYERAEGTTEEQHPLEKNVAKSFENPHPARLEQEVAIPRYTGAHISLDFKDADIRNILRLFAEVSNLNIVAGDDVQGAVTIRLIDVPWDQALDVILLSLSLGKTLQGNILRVASVERLRREELAAINIRQADEQLEPLKTVLIPVSYTDASELRDLIKALKGKDEK